jgi:DNA-binding CsgD family transcriptional regulator
VDPETQRNRDREVAQLRREGVPFRVIADRLGMSLGAVQKALRRAQKLPAVGTTAMVFRRESHFSALGQLAE